MASSLDKQPEIVKDGKYNKHTYKIVLANVTDFQSFCFTQTRWCKLILSCAPEEK